ncbi:hypothetical protein [Sphingobium yanoikuyae]|uniref:Uncharacterized protein n=1 Tax=Sphingobium yanoikuyae TaxID=13690 RepID=A0A3G2UQZ2_SPHYA|nr:hypothetical protein [Sphingobium yanoikuyae]AYO76412.1 hypothetical protein EBF16_05325 [Sphingobium yanoikuyae]
MIPHICTFSDPEDFRIANASGKLVWFFDWSDRFGPSLTNGKGDILPDPWPSERSPFWRVFHLWLRQGKRWGPSGVKGIRAAIWDEPPPGHYVVDQRGVIIETNEPEGFDSDYTPVEFVNEDGSPYRRRRKARP